jgi:hypothetical protein
MPPRIRILLQCSTAFAADDWHVGRFSLLAGALARVADVTARDREPAGIDGDPVMLGLSRTQYDEVWLLAVDGGTALTPPRMRGGQRLSAQRWWRLDGARSLQHGHVASIHQGRGLGTLLQRSILL